MATIWTRFGLTRTPFFQEPLEAGVPEADLERLFIGRASDRETLLAQLTHDSQTRVVMIGDPGVGKTTLMNRVLTDLRQEGDDRSAWLVSDLPPINLPGAATLSDFCVEVLRRVLDLRRRHQEASRAGRRGAARAKATAAGMSQRTWQALMPGTDLWEVVQRTVEGQTTVSPQIAGFGLTTQVTPPVASAGQWVPLTRAALGALAEETGQEILMPVNNAENMARLLAERAQDVLLDARDVFLTSHTHWLFVGTPDFFERVIAPQRQLAGVMQHPVTVAPLGPDDVRALLARRYEVLRIPGQPFVPPVALDTAVALARVFIGDLRELLRALEAAVFKLAHRGAVPVTLPEAMQVISAQQRELLRDRMQTAAWKHLQTLVLGSKDAPSVLQRFREADAVRLLAPMRQPTVNAHKQTWLTDGLVRSDGHTGASEWLVVTGQALLAMLPDALDMGKPLDALLRGRDLERQAADAEGAGEDGASTAKQVQRGRGPRK